MKKLIILPALARERLKACHEEGKEKEEREEPENPDYPKDPKFRERFGPRGVLKCKADGKGGQTIENTGALTKKRMETVDEEFLAAAKDFITRNQKAGGPWFCYFNTTRMHIFTHLKEASQGVTGSRW